MEPLTSGAIAVAILILNKAAEETGKKLGEKLGSTFIEQTDKLKKLVQRKDLPESKAIEQSEQSTVDFGKAVLEIDAAAMKDEELAKTVDFLTKAVKEDSELGQQIQKCAEEFQKSSLTTHSYTTEAREIGVKFEGSTNHGSITINKGCITVNTGNKDSTTIKTDDEGSITI